MINFIYRPGYWAHGKKKKKKNNLVPTSELFLEIPLRMFLNSVNSFKKSE